MIIDRVKRAAFHGLCVISRLRGMASGRKVVVYYVQDIFARKAEALASLLRDRGLPVEVRSGLSRAARVQLKARRDLWIGFWNSVPLEHMPQDYIFWNAEPISIKRWAADGDWSDLSQGVNSVRFHESRHLRSAWEQAIVQAKAMWSYTPASTAAAKQLGKSATFVPFGYAPYYEEAFRRSTGGRTFTQDIDVLFFGWLSDRRKRILDRLSERGMNVHIVSHKAIVVKEELDKLLARSKIVLGLHVYDDPDAQIADFARFDYLLSNRLFAIHERPSAEARHLEFERNVTTCEYDDIPDTCAFYLERPELRTTKAEQAYQWFKSDFAIERFIPFDEVTALFKAGCQR